MFNYCDRCWFTSATYIIKWIIDIDIHINNSQMIWMKWINNTWTEDISLVRYNTIISITEVEAKIHYGGTYWNSNLPWPQSSTPSLHLCTIKSLNLHGHSNFHCLIFLIRLILSRKIIFFCMFSIVHFCAQYRFDFIFF